MSQAGYRFQALLVPTTPLRVLDLHHKTQASTTSAEGSHGSWMPIYEFGDPLGDGGSMSSLVGYMPYDGGDLLLYLKDVRRIIEEPPIEDVERIEDALARTERIRAIAPLRTYSHDRDFKLRPNKTLEDYGLKIFRKPNGLLDFILKEVHGIDYKSLDKKEKLRAKAAGNGSLNEIIGSTLDAQARSLEWPLIRINAKKAGTNRWRTSAGLEGRPEDVALSIVAQTGERGIHCEGDSIKTLMKAASFELLLQHNLFNDRADVARRYFEAQCAILVDRRDEIVEAIRASTARTVSHAVAEILTFSIGGTSKAALDATFMLELYELLGPERLAAIAAIFVEKPYDYRAGWPDLTLIGPSGLRFVEVKTTDLFHDSQVRFAREMATPLGLHCEVVQLVAS